jgi:glycolate oxidase iron-sulfur subunit
MRTDLPAELLATPAGARANEILRNCVHCGFCNATCPTYELLGDELDGPRGRIYLIKNVLENPDSDDAVAVARTHLDRCLTCRACETTCPSGVQYGELAEIGREAIERRGGRPLGRRMVRETLQRVIPDRRIFPRLARLGRAFRWLLPGTLARQLPQGRTRFPKVVARKRRVVLLDGCVQGSLTPGVNATLAGLLDRKGIEAVLVSGEGCCGALALHLGDVARARQAMRANVTVLAPELKHAEAIVSTASGCGVTVKDYGRLLAADELAVHATAVADATVDVAEYLSTFEFDKRTDVNRVAWHAPCTLQHGQKITGVVEQILERAGYELVPVADAHFCCGSAGTYSLLQPELARTLRDRKLESLVGAAPDVIATANVGCQTHLAGGTRVPVVHWVELLR